MPRHVRTRVLGIVLSSAGAAAALIIPGIPECIDFFKDLNGEVGNLQSDPWTVSGLPENEEVGFVCGAAATLERKRLGQDTWRSEGIFLMPGTRTPGLRNGDQLRQGFGASRLTLRASTRWERSF